MKKHSRNQKAQANILFVFISQSREQKWGKASSAGALELF